MSNRSRMLVFCLAAGLGFGTLGACGGGMTSTGTSYKVQMNRELKAFVGAGHKDVHAAALHVVDDLGLTVEDEALDAFQGVITARTATQDKVTIQSYRKGDNATTVEIKVGSFGNEGRSRQILEGIETNLKKSSHNFASAETRS